MAGIPAAAANQTELFGGARLLLVYDGWCGVCTRSAGWLESRDNRRRIRALPSQTPGLIERLGLSREQVDATAWVIDRAGRRFSEGDAINLCLSALDRPWRYLALPYALPAIRLLERRFYRWFAHNRGRFARIGSLPACARPGAGCTPYGA